MDQQTGNRPLGGGRRTRVPPTVGEGHFKLLLDSVQDCGIVMVSRNGMILTWNRAAEEITGYTADEVIGQPLSLLYPPEEVLLRLPERELELARNNGTRQSEGWRLRKDGERVWVSHMVTLLHDRTGRLRGYGTATRLLSDRMRAQDLLAVLDAVPDAVLGIDPEGRILLANTAAEQLFGVGSGGLLGRGVDTLLPERFRVGHATARASYVQDSRPRLMTGRPHVTAARADGTEFRAEVRLSSVQTPRGPIVTVLVRELTRSDDPVPEESAAVQRPRNALGRSARPGSLTLA